jgi:hypothetical protein
LVSNKFKKIVKYIGIPIVPLWVGVFFVLNYIVFITGVNMDSVNNSKSDLNYANGFDEIKESFYAVGFAVLSLVFLKNRSKS